MSKKHTRNANRSDAQIAASRINGALSRGPVTLEGKRRSAANALRHGCRAATPELASIPCARTPEQEQQAAQRYDALLTRLRNHWKPSTPDLERLVEQLATICLRINRLHQCEEDILSFAGIREHRQQGAAPRTSEELERAALTLRSLQSLMRHDAQLDRARAVIEAKLRDTRLSVAHARTSEPDTEPGAPATVTTSAGTSEPTREPGTRSSAVVNARTSEPTHQTITSCPTNNIPVIAEPGPQPKRPTYGPDGRRIQYKDAAA